MFRGMSKEAMFAIGIGIILGVVAGYGAWTANRALKQAELVSPSSQEEEVLEKEFEKSSVTSNELQVSEPENGLVTDQNLVTVSGSAPKKSLLMVTGEQNDTVIKVDDESQFTTQVDLVKGINEITLAAIDESGGQKELTITVIYSDANIE